LQLKLWVVISYTLCIWFLYWIYHDHILFEKELAQANLLNYFGLIISIVLIILGTQLEKFGFSKNRKLTKHNIETMDIQTLHVQPLEKKEEKNQTPQTSTILPGCKYYLGYLHNRPKLAEMPEECIECENFVNCLSPSQTIQKQMDS
jgi:hypothetical protein